MEALQSSKDVVGIGGDDLRRAVDCYGLEHSGVAAGIAKKNIDLVKRRVEELVGFFLLELGWVIVGLDGLLFRKQFKVAFKGFGLRPFFLPKLDGRLQGFRRPPYKVRVALKPFKPGQRKPAAFEASSSATGVELPLSLVSDGFGAGV